MGFASCVANLPIDKRLAARTEDFALAAKIDYC